ncbi:FAD-binding oxidoreductase [Aminobacter sp. J44]|uniref:NAD(P)/FAD-dependent oxidoreductase n=1 Tax=Aminobacter sp. J44 TaxID=935262 RepID=UPI001199C86C|nr:FAD-binding oxidoreductase [Aminobacter sp. J44]TWG49550.1 4-methylaminobutanoate oxidase (formaldehyde-forming) [Aminobacter sp. J44]
MSQYIDQADVIVIGGGVIGASVAYHLTKSGISDVLVLERNELASGASARSAGCFTHSRSDVSTIRMINRTREAIAELEEILGEPFGFRQHGSVRAVFSEPRLQEMVAMEAVMQRAGLGVREIDIHEASELVPWLKLDNAVRTIFVPEDGYADGALLATSYLRAARLSGARVRRGVNVTGLIAEDGQIVGVETEEGPIQSRWVVSAPGVWGISVAGSINFGFPGAPTRSHYWITKPDGTGRPGQPNVQLPDVRAYFRSEVGGLLVGLQEPQSRTYDPLQLEEDMGHMNLFDDAYDLDLLVEQASALEPIIPDVVKWGFAHHIAGLSMYTPDGKFVVGRPDGTSGLIVAGGCCGSGLAASGGFGQVVADMISGRSPSIDTSLYDPNRFGKVEPASQEFRDRCAAARSSKSRGNLNLPSSLVAAQ